MANRVLVTGSRDWTDFDRLSDTLYRVHPTHLAHGASRGADRMAGSWAEARGVPVSPYPADWGRLSRGAGFARNQHMLDDFRPDLVVAFKDGFDYSLETGGTEHMVKIARLAGIPEIIIDALPKGTLFG